MNVLYLACEPRIELSAATGDVTHIVKAIKGLESKGHSVHRLIAGERSEERKAKSTFRALKTRLPSPVSVMLRDVYALFHDRRFLKHCYSMCRDKSFDFIYERSTAYHRTGQKLSKMYRIPHILEVNSPLEELLTLYGCARALIPVASHIERSTAREAHAVVVGSAGMRQYLIDRGVRPGNIFTIYPTADDHFFIPARRRAEIRQRFDLDGKMVVGFIGSMAPYQRVDLLLQAAVEVRRTSTAVHFFIVGDGPCMSELKRFVTDNGLEKSVSFTGRVPYNEIPEYSGAMDVCVIPHATWYGSPTKLFEYAASGKPVIAPRVEPIQEIIRDGQNGLLAEVGDVNDLATKILLLGENPRLSERLGGRLRQEILQNHTWDRNTDKLIEIFETTRRNGHKPSQNPF
jgi:glycosyltransferase involved in cell wall biosynthesis